MKRISLSSHSALWTIACLVFMSATVLAEHTIKAQWKSGEIGIDKISWYNGTWHPVEAEDDDISFAGGWENVECSGSAKVTEISGAYCEFTFSGTGIRIFSGPGIEGSQFDIYIDGNFDRTVTRNSDENTCNELVYERNDLSANGAPLIATQPANKDVCEGQSAVFSVVATGTPPLSFQWKKNGVNIPGATSASYSSVWDDDEDGSMFKCVVTNSVGSVTSQQAELNIILWPTFQTQPANKIVAVGASATFSVSVTGTAPITYQWKRNSEDIPGATGTSYTLTSAQTSDHGALFTCTAENTCEDVTSEPATLTIQGMPTAYEYPQACGPGENMRVDGNTRIGNNAYWGDEQLEVAGNIKLVSDVQWKKALLGMNGDGMFIRTEKYDLQNCAPIKFQQTLNGGTPLNRLVIDAQGRVGIGTDEPHADLQVGEVKEFGQEAEIRLGNSVQHNYWKTGHSQMTQFGGYWGFQFHTETTPGALVIQQDGDVGICNGDPQARLDVNGAIRHSGPMTSTILFHGTDEYNDLGTPGKPDGDGFRMRYDNQFLTENGYPLDFLVIEKTDGNWENPDGGIAFVNTGEDGEANTALVIRGNGRVGIGMEDPGSYRLAVEGKIGCRELVVTDAETWADHVFEKDYKLKSLDEVEKYIKAEKRLPGIPSAAEVKENGIAVGEMQAKLLEKIEELTLYVINVKKENELLKKKIDRMEQMSAK